MSLSGENLSVCGMFQTPSPHPTPMSAVRDSPLIMGSIRKLEYTQISWDKEGHEPQRILLKNANTGEEAVLCA